MGCERVELKLPDGEVMRAIVCSRGRRRKKCACGATSTKLCDFPKGMKSTCSAHLCDACTSSFGTNRDLCPAHAQAVRDAGVAESLLADPSWFALRVAADAVAARAPTKGRPPAAAAPARPPARAPTAARCAPGDGDTAARELDRALRPPAPARATAARDHALRPRDYAEWLELVEERAAIFEYLGEVTRAAAEQLARDLVGPAPRWGKAGPLFAGAR